MATSYYLTDSSTESLVEFLAACSSQPDEEFFRAREECSLARYALRDKMNSYCALKDSIKAISTRDPDKAINLLSHLDAHAERMISTVDKLVSILKKASEIEIISSTKFDGVQLYHAIQQLPAIISNILDDNPDSADISSLLSEALKDKLLTITSNVNANSVPETVVTSMLESVPVLQLEEEF